jgi:hypothetical protein
VVANAEIVFSPKQVSVWCNQFKEGRTSLLDEERAGRPTTACNAEMNVEFNNFGSLIVV